LAVNRHFVHLIVSLVKLLFQVFPLVGVLVYESLALFLALDHALLSHNLLISLDKSQSTILLYFGDFGSLVFELFLLSTRFLATGKMPVPQ
jgi:hypothetical protein